MAVVAIRVASRLLPLWLGFARGTAALRTLAGVVGPVVHEVKKSNFIATCSRVDSLSDALAFREQLAGEHAKAGHTVMACVCTDGERAMDDGEPTGTAGQPILSAIRRAGLEHCVVVVARYRNGPKLGAGGLIRAYGAAARLALSQAEEEGLVQEIEPRARVTIGAPISAVGSLYSLAGMFGGHNEGEETIVGEDYADEEVRITFSVPSGAEDELLSRARDLTAGKAHVVNP